MTVKITFEHIDIAQAHRVQLRMAETIQSQEGIPLTDTTRKVSDGQFMLFIDGVSPSDAAVTAIGENVIPNWLNDDAELVSTEEVDGMPPEINQ